MGMVDFLGRTHFIKKSKIFRSAGNVIQEIKKCGLIHHYYGDNEVSTFAIMLTARPQHKALFTATSMSRTNVYLTSLT